jgi:fructose-specific PTS system IIC-like component
VGRQQLRRRFLRRLIAGIIGGIVVYYLKKCRCQSAALRDAHLHYPIIGTFITAGIMMWGWANLLAR